MTKEISFKIEVPTQEDFEKVQEMLRVHVANLELSQRLKIVDLGIENLLEESR